MLGYSGGFSVITGLSKGTRKAEEREKGNEAGNEESKVVGGALLSEPLFGMRTMMIDLEDGC